MLGSLKMKWKYTLSIKVVKKITWATNDSSFNQGHLIISKFLIINSKKETKRSTLKAKTICSSEEFFFFLDKSSEELTIPTFINKTLLHKYEFYLNDFNKGHVNTYSKGIYYVPINKKKLL